jgi:hypothetical protein
MKKIFLVSTFLLLACTLSFGQTKSAKDLIGKWTSDGDVFVMEFIDTSTVLMSTMGQKRPANFYTADFSKTPVWLDISMGEGKRKVTIKSIIEFVDDDTIRWQSSQNEERPTAFEQKRGASLITLKRKK